MKKMLLVLLLLPLLAACGQAKNPLGEWIPEYDKDKILLIDKNGGCALSTAEFDYVYTCSYKEDDNNIQLNINILKNNYVVNAAYDKSKDVLNVSYGNNKNVFYRKDSADAKKINDTAPEDKDIFGIILKTASEKKINDIKVSAKVNQEFPVEIHNTGQKINNANDFSYKFYSSLSDVGKYLMTCSKNVDSPTGDLTNLNQCKKNTALKLQDIADLQGPIAYAAKEKTMDELIVEYNNLTQAIKTTMTEADITNLTKKLETWHTKISDAITDYMSS